MKKLFFSAFFLFLALIAMILLPNDGSSLDSQESAVSSEPIPVVPSSAHTALSDQSVTAFNELPSSEQTSLRKAFSEARREVRAIPEAWGKRPENTGFDFYALHPKQKLNTRFGAQGVQIVSSNSSYTEEDTNNSTTAWQAQLRLRSFAGEEVQGSSKPRKSDQSSTVLEYRHSTGLTEWFDNGIEGIEHGYTIASRPRNLKHGEEVSIEIALEGLHVAKQERNDGSEALVFREGEREVLSYSKLVVFDARGRKLPASMKPTDFGFSITYDDTSADYPVIVDPIIINEEAKLGPSDTTVGDTFGWSVAIDGSTLIIGAPGNDGGGNESGIAYVFIQIADYWALQATLTADDAAADDAFGTSVSINGDSVVIGAPGDDDGGADSGSAYVFVQSGTIWSQESKLTASDAAADDSFGSSVGISGGSVIIGSSGGDDSGSDSGVAYIFTRTGSAWNEQTKLNAADAAADDLFGSSVSIFGDSVIVGAHQNDDDGNKSGSAYIFTRTGSAWNEQAKLTASDAAAEDQFGWSVAISNDSVIIGGPGDDDGGNDSGSAYVFIRSGSIWSQQAKLTASGAAAGDHFGHSVAIDGNSVVIGAYGDGYFTSNTGSSYLFTRSGSAWSQHTKFTAPHAEEDDKFGWSVGISGNFVINGTPFENAGDLESGSVYVFTTYDTNWHLQTELAVTDGNQHFGESVAISGNSLVIGTPDDNNGGTFSGAAYVFTRSGSTWSQQAKLTPSDPKREVDFGSSVAIDGDTIVIGAVYDSEGAFRSGAAYVFTRTGTNWLQQAKLTDSNAEASDYFGVQVAIFGDTVAIGVPGDNDDGGNSGSAYIFTRSGSTWPLQTKLTASDAVAGDYFGVSIAIFGDTVTIGALNDDDHGSSSGSAYIFTRSGSTWSQQTKLTASDAGAGNQFGASVAIFEDSVVIGARSDGVGSAYVFTRNGSIWSQEAKLVASDLTSASNFGNSVSISGNSVVVGVPYDRVNGHQSGSAYVFMRNDTTWVEQGKFIASDGAESDRFGHRVAISGNSVVIGAHQDNDRGYNSGSAYIFRLPRLRVVDSEGLGMGDGGSATEFPTLKGGATQDFSFRLMNVGELDLDIQTISLGGVDSDQFSLTLPDLSPAVDLIPNQSLVYTITFNPTGSISGLWNATVTINSNDIVAPEFIFNIAGLGLSGINDEDGDNMNDWGEYSLRDYGFDWQITQTDEVSFYYDNAAAAGLVTESQIAGGHDSGVLADVDETTGTARFVIMLQESPDLDTFVEHPVNPANLSVDGDGNIRYEVDASNQQKFIRAGLKP